jgi:hypothetical protein
MSNQPNAVAVHEPTSAPVLPESAAILQVIERAALNPNVDIDKMERLLEMQQRIVARNAQADFAAALAEMQAELPVIKERGKNTNTGSKYALWEDVNEQIRPILGKHGFSISSRTKTEGDFVAVTGVLTHRGGHSEETTFTLPVDKGPSRNLVQAHGSSISYGKRYTAAALLNLTSRGEDDDGNGAGAAPVITEEQVLQLRELIEAVEADEAKFCKFLKVGSLSVLPAKRYDEAVKELKAFGRNNGKRV